MSSISVKVKGSRGGADQTNDFATVPMADQQAYLAALAASTTPATVQAADAGGRRLRLLGGTLSASAAVVVIFQDDAGTPNVLFRTPRLQANTPFTFSLELGQVVADPTKNLQVVVDAGTATLDGTLQFVWE